MNDRDDVGDLLDRMRAKMRRGEDPGLELKIEFAALTDQERADFMARCDQLVAHGAEHLEALDEDYRILSVLLAHVAGSIGAQEAVDQIRDAVPDPLAE